MERHQLPNHKDLTVFVGLFGGQSSGRGVRSARAGTEDVLGETGELRYPPVRASLASHPWRHRVLAVLVGNLGMESDPDCLCKEVAGQAAGRGGSSVYQRRGGQGVDRGSLRHQQPGSFPPLLHVQRPWSV